MVVEMPRVVRVQLTHGRSIPFTFQGVSKRMRKGDVEVMPYPVYVRYSHKLRLVDDEEYERLTAAMQSEEVVKRSEEGLKALPEWTIGIPPEEYWRLYKDKEKKSPTLEARLKLAKQLMEK